MIKCKFCGAENPDGTRFCSFCGGKINNSANNTIKLTPNQNNTQRKRNPINPWVLVWSIVNITLGLFGLIAILPFSSSILGVIAIVFLILAQDYQNPKSEKTKIRIAIILNIVASSILIISFILFIAFLFNELIMPLSMPHNSLNIESFMEMYPSLD